MPKAKPTAPFSDGQRALWVFLAATLLGPFVAAMVIFVLTAAAGVFGFGPPSAKAAASTGTLTALAAERALQTYIWGAFPAAVAGAASAAWLSLRGQLPWLAPVCFAAVATTFAATVSGAVARDHLTPIAFIAASSALVVWLILKRARIIPADNA